MPVVCQLNRTGAGRVKFIFKGAMDPVGAP